ncbi:MAG TPA: TonB-dependent receptor [Oligoflexus sp.]|uniref:TonB-dependent receptor plug domain-containing protein n=1 Tax=Oligoflexus sp. TaxID=1971216 RepID=UPI002D4F0CBF|nr:TonB-dependent receptor [Oligoflexus sp.]HYX39703.1 TonB-dependent receptor [Oligoflexus sp.]
MRLTRLLTLILLIYSFTADNGFSQEEYDELSLDELLNVEIIELVTKKPEPLFESSLDVSVLHYEQISRAGATSIPEALRLIPGMVVREQSPGVYDVHIQGLDNVSINKLLPFPSSTTLLVMIDYRVVYNYFSGGTFWESLPIGLHDIERIEVIRGPSSALYGPNAVSGVINLVTRDLRDKGVYQRSSFNVHDRENFVANAAVGYNSNNKFTTILSVNASQRTRFSKDNYDWSTKNYKDLRLVNTTLLQPDLDNPEDTSARLDRLSERYPDPETSIKNYGANLFSTYDLGNNSSLELNGGIQSSMAQKILVNNFATPLTTNESDTYYMDFRGKFNKLSTQVTTVQGEQQTNGMSDWKYDLAVNDAAVDYTFEFTNLMIRPAVNYREATYKGEFIGGEEKLTGVAASLLTDYSLLNNDLKLLAAARIDRYNNPDDDYVSYQFSTRYKVNVNQMLHAAYSRANRAPFMVDNYLQYRLSTDESHISYLGNTDLSLMTVDSIDMGWRGKLSGSLTAELSAFVSEIYNLSDLVFDKTDSSSGKAAIDWKYKNIDRKAFQKGFTTALSIAPSRFLTFTPFVTWQDTRYETEGQKEDEDQPTPAIYGGFSASSTPTALLNLNVNGFFLGEQAFPNVNGTEKESLGQVFILNAKASYPLSKELDLFVNGRNLTGGNDGKREYGYGDRIGRMVFVGLSTPGSGG